MKELTQQQELDRESNIKEKFLEEFNKYDLEDLYLIQEVLEKEIKLSETAIEGGFE